MHTWGYTIAWQRRSTVPDEDEKQLLLFSQTVPTETLFFSFNPLLPVWQRGTGW